MGSTGSKGGTIQATQSSQDDIRTYSKVDMKYTYIDSEEDYSQIAEGANRYFQSGNSFAINNALREDRESSLSEGNQKTIDTMDRNMRPLDKDIVVYRMCAKQFVDKLFNDCGVSSTDAILAQAGNKEAIDRINAKIAGVEFSPKSYVSTSTKKDFDWAFTGRPLMMQCTATKGTKAMFSPTGKEHEMVLGRNTDTVIHRLRWDSNENKLVLDTSTKSKK